MKLDRAKYLVLSSHCIQVKGARYSVIQDNLRHRIIRIPEQVYDFLQKFNRKTIGESLMEVEEPIASQIISYLLEKEFIFLTNNPLQFPVVQDTFEMPELINNCIIEYNSSLIRSCDNLPEDLIKLGCKHLEIRCFEGVKSNEVKYILETFSRTRILSLDLILKYTNKVFFNDIIKLTLTMPMISSIVFHSVINTPPSKVDIPKSNRKVIIISDQIKNSNYCGLISQQFFTMSPKAFRLSKNFNSCLYGKMAITKEGDIKQCPSMRESLGNIRSDSLYSIASKNLRNLFSTITKDQVQICVKCEYRYACSDCRAFLTKPNDIFSKPLKCGYDPERGTWSQWSEKASKDVLKYYDIQVDEVR